MTTTSFPAVGNGGFTDAQWATLYGSVDGIYNDFTTAGDAFKLEFVSASNIARILAPVVPTGSTVPMIKVNGYGLQVTANEDFVVPSPPSTTTYRIFAQYDPALNVADGSGNANPLGPVRLVFTSSEIDLTGGKQAVLLYDFQRAPGQSLSSVEPADYRRWVGPQLSVDLMYVEHLPGIGPFPRGTVITEKAGPTYIREPNSSNVLRWMRVHHDEGTGAITLASGMSASDTAPRYTIPSRGNTVQMRGTIKRTSGAAIVSASATADVTIGSIPSTYAPSSIRRFPVYGSGQRLAYVKVTAEGTIAVYAGGVSIEWVDLSNVSYQIG